jgi:cyclomaltodextrinase / maltogenic alpha-amylase / neopullulanase
MNSGRQSGVHLNRNNEFNSVFLPNVFLGNHDVTRIASELKDDRDVELALAVLCTIPGTPSIYYGDEQGYKARKEKRPGGDDEIRPVFPESPESLQGNESFYNLYRKLLWLRRNNSWIASSRIKVISLNNQTLVYETTDGANKLLVALNASDASFTIPASINLNPLAMGRGERHSDGWKLDAHSWAILA